jgi:uncharacterized protein YciI
MKNLINSVTLFALLISVVSVALTARRAFTLNQPTSPQTEQITDEFINRRIAQGREYLLVVSRKGPIRNQDAPTLEKIQQAHQRHLFRLRGEGKLLLGGPSLEDSDLRGIAIYNLTDKEELKKILEADPAVKAGRLSFEIYRWFGLPGDSLPR